MPLQSLFVTASTSEYSLTTKAGPHIDSFMRALINTVLEKPGSPGHSPEKQDQSKVGPVVVTYNPYCLHKSNHKAKS